MTSHTIDKYSAGTRIDVYLVAHQPTLSRGVVTRAIKDGLVLCNGTTVKPSYRTQPGDVITYDTIPSPSGDLVPRPTIPLTIVAETPDFFIINKQRGLQVHPSSTEKNETLANALIAHEPTLCAVGDDPQRPGIMHRLDKYTSGLMVIARNQKTFVALKALFAARKVHKTYYTLVWGLPQGPDGIIDAPIARAMSYTRQKVVLNNAGRYRGEIKEAQTAYHTLMTFDAPFTVHDTHAATVVNSATSTPFISLLAVRPQSGRMHQIRVHMRHIGHPVVGDVKYETKEFRDFNTAFFRTLPPEDLHTFYLHAQHLSFTLDDNAYSFTAPLPTYFTDALPATWHTTEMKSL